MDDIVTEPVAPLSTEQEAFLSKKPNYEGLLEELKSFREQALCAVKNHLSWHCMIGCSVITVIYRDTLSLP